MLNENQYKKDRTIKVGKYQRYKFYKENSSYQKPSKINSDCYKSQKLMNQVNVIILIKI